MARQNHGPLSRAKGKIGGVVYQQYEGMQISREYQPVVKNPQSESQTTNRSAFKLASQIVGIFREIINARLATFSIYTRNRRGAALASIKRKATIGTGEGATIKFIEVASAINMKSLTEYAAPTTNISNEAVTVVAPGGSTIMVTIAGFDTNGNYVGRKVATAPMSGSEVEFPIPSEYTMTKAMALYTVPQTEEGRAIFDNLNDYDATLNINVERLIANGDIAVSDIAAVSNA